MQESNPIVIGPSYTYELRQKNTCMHIQIVNLCVLVVYENKNEGRKEGRQGGKEGQLQD